MRDEIVTSNASKVMAAAIVLVLVCLFVYYRFDPWFSPTVMGDDLSNMLASLHGEFASSLPQSLMESYAARYRPVFQVAWWALVSVFGPIDNKPFEIANVLLTGTGVWVFSLLAYRASGRNAGVALAVALALAWSRMLIYQVITTTGLLESLGFLFFATSYYFVDALEKRTNSRQIVIAVAATYLMIYAHERYIGLAVVYALMAFWVLRPAGIVTRSLTAVAFLSAGVTNFLLKTFVTQSGFFIGTGGTGTMKFDPGVTMMQTVTALESLFGFNNGVPGFFGEQYSTVPTPILVIAAILPVCALASVPLYFLQKQAGEAKHYVLISTVAVCGALLLPAVVTVPVQPRWLIEPFAVVLIWLARTRLNSLVFAFVIASVAVDMRYTKSFDDLVWVSGPRASHAVRQYFIDGALGAAGPLNLVAHPNTCDWGLQNGGIFELYAGKRREVNCIYPMKAVATFAKEGAIFYPTQLGAYRELDSGEIGGLGVRLVSYPQIIDRATLAAETKAKGMPVWLKTSGALDPDFEVEVDGNGQPTMVAENYMTTTLSPALLATPGRHELRIKAIRRGRTVESVPVVVEVK